MPKPFVLVTSLWVAVDFEDVLAGKAEPPWVDHDEVDFEALAGLLREAFVYGPPVRIRVPNDTIDQTTIFSRMGEIPIAPDQKRGSATCDDFGQALLRAAHESTGDVIDVRRLWTPFHYMKNRRKAPPPMALPFVIEAADFEDAMINAASMLPVLGLPMPSMFGEDAVARAKRQEQPGRLPDSLRKGLEALFQCKYEGTVFLNRLACDPAPIG